MNEEIFSRLNSKVKVDDCLYFLGDFAFALDGKLEKIYDYRDRITCKCIHFILGNHDQLIRKHREVLLRDNVFNTISDVYTVYNTKPSMFLSHYAHRVWEKSHHGRYHLFAHSHGTLEDDPASLSFDVGVDTNNFYPYSFDDIKEKMGRKTWKPVDHHNERTVQ